MQGDKYNVTNSLGQMQCDKWDVTMQWDKWNMANANWQMECYNINMTKIMWKKQFKNAIWPIHDMTYLMLQMQSEKCNGTNAMWQ